MDAEARFLALADRDAYASSKGLWPFAYWHNAEDGNLLRLSYTAIGEDWSAGQCIEATVVFDPTGDRADYRETYLLSDGGKTASVYKMPFDFSESYTVGDVWTGVLGSPWPEMKDFKDPESLVDFLADRLQGAV